MGALANELDGQVAVISGGAGAMGSASARRLAEQGARPAHGRPAALVHAGGDQHTAARALILYLRTSAHPHIRTSAHLHIGTARSEHLPGKAVLLSAKKGLPD
jgi:NAD(P)-dependent dehydrogenase (short-subunit alcohol dehydrogenase family)